MTRKEFKDAITHAVMQYTKAPEFFDANPQLRINPATLEVISVNGKDYYKEIEDSDEVIENEAAADGDATEDAEDFQASRNPDFYSIKEYVITDNSGNMEPDMKAIDKLAAQYVK